MFSTRRARFGSHAGQPRALVGRTPAFRLPQRRQPPPRIRKDAQIGLNALRQQIRPDARIHGVITHGGVAPNIIPDYTAARFYLRSVRRGYLVELVDNWLSSAVDPALPVVLAAHASVEGAVYGGERSVMLGGDLVLPGSLVRDPRLDYVALGHIHKAQDLNPRAAPPVIYPGSIERVNWGEAAGVRRWSVTRFLFGMRRKKRRGGTKATTGHAAPDHVGGATLRSVP